MNYFEKANDYYNIKDYRNAITLYSKCIESREKEPASLYNSAVCFIKLKEYNDAIPLLKRAISLKRQSIYFFNLGYCYSMINDNKKALIYFNVAWSLDNSDNDCEKAINLLVNKIKKNP